MQIGNGNGNCNFREFGDFRLDMEKCVLWHLDQPVNLQPKEIELLGVLTDSPGEVVTKQELMDRVWPNSFVEESNLSRHIYRLRRTFEGYGLDGGVIQTVPRRGYRFTKDVTSNGATGYVVERHSISRTLIEELQTSTEPAFKPIVSIASKGRRSRVAVGFALFALVGVAAAAFLVGPNFDSKKPIRNIAVLPFRTLDDSNENPRRGIGITDLLITRLSNIGELSIRPTSSVIEYDGQTVDLTQIGEKLQVDAVVEGTVSQVGDQVRVTAQLVRIADNASIWSTQFTKTDGNEAYLQNELAMQIVDALALSLSVASRSALTKRYTDNPDAMQMYQLGRYHWSKRSNEGIAEAERLFRNAIEADPKFALAYAGLADTQIFGPTAPLEAILAINKALELDPDLGEVYATRGFTRMFHNWEWNKAEEDFQRSIDLNPGYPTAYQWYASLLMMRGRQAEAKEKLLQAIAINPNSYNLYGDLCQASYYAKEYEDAEVACKKALDIMPEFHNALSYLSNVYILTGRHEEALTLREGLFQLSVQTLHSESDRQSIKDSAKRLTETFRNGGMEAYWLAIANRDLPDTKMDPGSFIGRAQAEVALGDHRRALTALENAVARHAFLAPFINADPIFDPLRNHPQFNSIIAKMGL